MRLRLRGLATAMSILPSILNFYGGELDWTNDISVYFDCNGTLERVHADNNARSPGGAHECAFDALQHSIFDAHTLASLEKGPRAELESRFDCTPQGGN